MSPQRRAKIKQSPVREQEGEGERLRCEDTYSTRHTTTCSSQKMCAAPTLISHTLAVLCCAPAVQPAFFPHLLLSPFCWLALLPRTPHLSLPGQPSTASDTLSRASSSAQSWQQAKDAMNLPGLTAADQAMCHACIGTGERCCHLPLSCFADPPQGERAFLCPGGLAAPACSGWFPQLPTGIEGTWAMWGGSGWRHNLRATLALPACQGVHKHGGSTQESCSAMTDSLV